MKKILFLIDPQSIHDLNWIASLSTGCKGLVIVRKCHEEGLRTMKDFFQAKGISVLGTVSDFSVFWILRTLLNILKIRRLIKNNNIDLFHIFYAEPNALWAFPKRIFKVPIIVTTRGTDILHTIPQVFELDGLINRVVRKLYRISFRNLIVITCTSERQKNSIEKYIPKIQVPVHIIRTGVDTIGIQASSATTPSQLENSKFILFPRAMTPNYNHEFSLRVISHLPEDIRKNFKMVFLYRNGKNTAYISTILELMGSIDAEIVFLDALREAVFWELLKKSSLVVMNPFSDGSPVSALEALYCGCKLILGPAKYDDILLKYAGRFTEWSEAQVAKMVEDTLSEEFPDRQHAHSFVERIASRNREMAKVLNLYNSL